MTVYVHALGHFHPENEVTNEFLEELDIGTDDEWIQERVGITSRRTVLPLEYIRETKNVDVRAATEATEYTTSDLGVRAAELAISRAGISKADIGMVIGGGSVGLLAGLSLFTLANKLTTAANAIFLQDTAPFYILLLGPLLLGERIRRQDIAFMLALAVGLVLIFGSIRAPVETATNPELGNLLAACAGVSWALTVLGLRWLAVRSLENHEQPEAAVVTGCFVASVVAVPFAFPVADTTVMDWLIVLYLGVFQIGLAYLFIAEGMRHIPALETSLLLLVEPVFSPIWAWLLLAESPGTLAVFGGGIVILATAIHSLQRRREAVPMTS